MSRWIKTGNWYRVLKKDTGDEGVALISRIFEMLPQLSLASHLHSSTLFELQLKGIFMIQVVDL